MQQSMTSSLVPVIHKNEFDQVATEFLQKYCPEALESPMPIPIWDIVGRKMRLNIIQSESVIANGAALGAIVFSDGLIEVYDSVRKEYVGYSVSNATVFIDKNIDNEGRVNNALAHECIHWWKHRNYFNYKKILDKDHGTAVRCLTAFSDEVKDSWDEIDWMEWQARGIAPKILMPRKTAEIKAEEFLHKYDVPGQVTIHKDVIWKVIVELAAFFHVSKQAASIRLEELGISNATAVYYEKINRNFDYGEFKIISRKDDATIRNIQPITSKDLIREYCKNPAFKDVIDSGQFRFVDGYLVLDDEKYLTNSADGKWHMTEYADQHLLECVLNFQTRFIRKSSKTKDATLGMLFSLESTEGYMRLPQYAPNPQNLELYDKAIALKNFKAKFQKEYDENNTYNKSLSQRLCGIMDEKHWNVSIFQDNTLLTDGAWRDAHKENYKPTLKTLVSICVGLQLPFKTSEELLRLGGYVLNTSLEHQAYQCILTEFQGCTIYECNDVLAELDVDSLGSVTYKK